ncbi:MAG: sn-glycerol-3-phosphate ABC transporter ATP-binding protein UgpC [Candidatus Omnitrophica bacterium]|nr:sn-glycerol-3-phosphate ABC transporter ATP-binding protein UgpC [Candidatus Omnitrophota bacterium]
MSQVSLVKVRKVYPSGIQAVNDVSLGIERREFVVLVGPSGCGKTTVLRMIAGLEQATSGTLYIGDRIVNDVPPKDRDIAMVFQNYALYPHMSVFENMAFALKLRKYPKSEITARVNDTAEILGIKGLLERKPKELSGGQRQRVALGRAIVRKPLVFLFDEPLSNLDAKLRVQMRTEIKKLHQRLQTTMIYVTHDQTEALTMGDRIVVLKDGVVQQVADPITLYDRPVNKFTASFIGMPPMNFIEGTVIKMDGKFYFQSGSCKLRVVDSFVPALASYVSRSVIFGIRAEDIYDKLFAVEASPDNTVRAVCEVVEPMGAEAYLYLRAGSSAFVARVSGHIRPGVNQDIDLVFDMSKAHFFDKNTEKSVIGASQPLTTS